MSNFFRPVDFNSCEPKAICGGPGECQIYNVNDTCLDGFEFDAASCSCLPPDCNRLIGEVTLSPIDGCGAANGVFDDIILRSILLNWVDGGWFKSIPQLPEPVGWYYDERCLLWQDRGVLWGKMRFAETCDGEIPEGGLSQEVGQSQGRMASSSNASQAKLYVQSRTYDASTDSYILGAEQEVGCWVPGPITVPKNPWSRQPDGVLPCA